MNETKSSGQTSLTINFCSFKFEKPKKIYCCVIYVKYQRNQKINFNILEIFVMHTLKLAGQKVLKV